jgi:hypothetical protein
MNFVEMVHLGKIKHDNLLREAEQSRKVLHSPQVRALPRLAQVLILLLT